MWAQSLGEKLYQSSFDKLYPISDAFENTKLNSEFNFKEFRDDNVLVTEDFMRTVERPLMKVIY